MQQNLIMLYVMAVILHPFLSVSPCRPCRFLEDHPEHAKYKPRDKYAYIPFGAGAHKCLGYKLAEEEALLTLVKFMQKFEVRVDPEHHKGDLHLLNAITLVPKDGIWLKVFKRRD